VNLLIKKILLSLEFLTTAAYTYKYEKY